MIDRYPWGGLADPSLPLPPDLAILGLPYEGGACYRLGAATAPARLRSISSSSPAISESGEVVDAAQFRVRDLGDVVPPPADAGGAPAVPGSPGGAPGAAAGAGPAVPDPERERARRDYFARVEQAVLQTFRVAAMGGRDTFLLSIGGDHSVTIPLLRGFENGFPEGYGLISLDAHPDLFDTYEGSPLSNACPIRRALDGSRLKPEHLLILGTRSYNQLELDFLRERDIRYVPAREIDRSGVDAVVAAARDRMRGVGNIYLTVDIDVADPSCAPGTGAPVAGGLSSRQLLDLTRGLLENLPVRAMDLVEVSPPLDPTDATLFLALQIVFETIAVLARKRRPVR
jgi:agmatinase